METVSSGDLPVVSKSSIQRYVTDDAIMTENENVPLSFAQCTPRGANANTTENKDLRTAKRTELDQDIRAGNWIVFVDESPWEVGNEITRKWGEKDKQ